MLFHFRMSPWPSRYFASWLQLMSQMQFRFFFCSFMTLGPQEHTVENLKMWIITLTTSYDDAVMSVSPLHAQTWTGRRPDFFAELIVCSICCSTSSCFAGISEFTFEPLALSKVVVASAWKALRNLCDWVDKAIDWMIKKKIAHAQYLFLQFFLPNEPN